MRTIEIGQDTVAYYYKDDQGDTVRQELQASDRAYITARIDKGEERGRTASGNLTLHWNVEY